MSSLSVDEKHKIVGALCEQYLQKILSKLKDQHDTNDPLKSSDINTPCYFEIQLWSQLKKYIETSEINLVNCIHGFYVYLLQVAFSLIKGPTLDMYFIRYDGSDRVIKVKGEDNLLLYNIYIRLGDLNRYLKNLKMARYYYYQAREVNPLRGHAYNQLALVSTTEIFKSIYYSVRALLATEEPVAMAENNIKSVVNRSSLINPNMDPLFTDRTSEIDANRVDNWLHFVTIAIYCDKMRIVLPSLVKEINKVIQLELNKPRDKPFTSKLDSKYIFSACDAAIDMVLSRPNDERLTSFDLEKESAEMKTGLGNLLKDAKSPNEKIGLALKHDYLLLGFSPLKDTHSQLDFSNNPPSDIENIQLLLLRISDKLDKLINLLSEKKAKSRAKKTRNIALQSILGSKGTS